MDEETSFEESYFSGQGERNEREENDVGEAGWFVAGRPRKQKQEKPKVSTGSAKGEGLLDLAGPAEFWIGNTRADTEPEKVLQVLHQAADNLGIENFSVEKAICLTKGDHVRTRSWKVIVPARLKEHMNNPELYPAGWTFRVFTQWNKKKHNSAAADPKATNVATAAPATSTATIAATVAMANNMSVPKATGAAVASPLRVAPSV